MLSTNGITLEYDDIGAVVTQQRSLGYYRGESAFYGFPTTLMDITSDVQTALFFMCCKYEDNVWKPLITSDINKRDARNSISSIGGDSRYGILYIADREIMDMKYLLNSDCRKNGPRK